MRGLTDEDGVDGPFEKGMAEPIKPTLQSGRVPCPKCKRKGVGYAGHPHAFGWKDYTKATCRYCRAIFKVREKAKSDA